MRIRSAFAFLLAALGSAAGAILFSRRLARRRDRAELYFEDGSLVTLRGAEAAPLLAPAREILSAARG